MVVHSRKVCRHRNRCREFPRAGAIPRPTLSRRQKSRPIALVRNLPLREPKVMLISLQTSPLWEKRRCREYIASPLESMYLYLKRCDVNRSCAG
jgi:hypothetical protein